MGLTYENIKSIILAILIVTSLLLTWNLWTYQPNYEELKKSKVVQEVSLSPKKDIKEIVKAEQSYLSYRKSVLWNSSRVELEKL